MTDMRQAASQLAAKGRFGDSMLIHVSPAEVEGIASLIPGGLTINPHTGLPEAFFFLPFLASLFGAAAPAAAGAAAAAAPALAAGAAGAGAAGAAGATAAGLAAAAPAIAAPALATGVAGLGSSASAMTAGTLAKVAAAKAAAAKAATAAPALIGGGGVNTLAGGAGVDAMTTGAIKTAATQALPQTMAAPAAKPIMGALANPAGQSYAGAGTATLGPAAPTSGFAALNPPITAANTAPAVSTATTTAAPAVSPTLIPPITPANTQPGGIGGLFNKIMGSKNLPLYMMGLSAAGNALGGLFQKKEKGEKGKDVSKMKYSGGSPVFSGRPEESAYREENYFPNYQYANGGIVTLADGGVVDPQMQPPQDMSFPMAGVPGGMGDEAPMLEDIPSSPYPTSQIGAEPEPPPGETAEPTSHNDRELIAQTVEAIQGKVAEPGPILLAFVNEFGEPALQDLAARVKAMPATEGGQPPMTGVASDGQSDSIPAMIDGQQPAALSEGEFVVPADAVSGLGNGSTDAGAQQLQGMVDGVRQMRTGGAVQPPQINPQQLMPYAGGGLVSLFKDGGKVKRPMQGPVDPLYDLDQYRPGILPEALDQWIPSVLGYATTGDPFASGPEIRRAQAMRERAEAARRRN